ncbi:MAG: LysM peptidoglycan-binding domain-containing protein [Bacteroidota bacterium]|nr:LysM peptidoglycan-binding domain-containing protein [Bacteroidota bacterium]
MKKVLVIVSFFCAVVSARSQNVAVEGTAPNLYITHTVAPKDNFYSVGRLYNQNPKVIATFNNLAMEKGLAIGQRIKIPLNAQNFDASGSSNGQTVPLTHVVGKSETLSKIGSDLNVAAQTIREWNSLSSDNIAPGTPLVVGHLKMSSTSGMAKTSSATDEPVAVKGSETRKQSVNLPPAEKQAAAAETKQSVPDQAKPAALAMTQLPVEKKELPVAVKQEPVKQVEPLQNSAAKELPAKQEVAKENYVKESAPKMEQPAKAETYSYASTGAMGSVEGVFANVFTTDVSQKSVNNKSGEAATFKSTSGWQDRKYYVLMNDVAPGTIVKIASTENKVVYAKVLGSMPDMKENNGLLLRISNAAASYLGIIDPKFPVQISFYQ